ncbi:MAG: amidohydrolase family protein, partial [Rhodospirillaceae bacterium]
MRSLAWTLILLCGFSSSGHAQQDTAVYLTGGHLVDVVRGEIYEDIGVLIENERITGLFFDFPYNADRIPDDAVRVDVGGKYLIPGLFDLHVHAYTQFRDADVDLKHFFKMFLAGGVTTVRAMSPDMAELIRVKTEIDAGMAAGPNIVIGSSPAMEQAPGFPKIERTDILNTPRDARQRVRDHAFRGAEWIKFYNHGDAEMVQAVVDEAHKHGRKVFGHFSKIGAAEAARLGVDSLEHTVSLLQSALDYEDAIALTDVGYYRLFVLWPRLNQEKLDAVFQVLVENGTAVIPTLAVQAVVTDPDEVVARSADWLELYQTGVSEAYLEIADRGRAPSGFNFGHIMDDWRASITIQAEQMARFANMGGIVATGSDLISAPPLVPGLSIQQE